MSLSYSKLKHRPALLKRLAGLTLVDFEKIMKELRVVWDLRIVNAYKKQGRKHKLSLEDRLLMLLIYYRTYTNQVFIGYLMGVDDSRVCRLIQQLEPLLAGIVAINKDKKLTESEVQAILLDATEQRVERPKKNQKAYYSGKKKPTP